MPNSLHGLQVSRVDVVNRASVRDTVNKDEPMRWLLWKAETPPASVTGAAGQLDFAHVGELTHQHEHSDGTTHSHAHMHAAGAPTHDGSTHAHPVAKAESTGDTPMPEETPVPAPVPDPVNPTPVPDPAPTPEPVNKAELPAPVRAMLEKAESERDAARSEIAKAQADASEAMTIAKAEKDARVLREFTDVAKSMSNLPVGTALAKDENGGAVDRDLAVARLFKSMADKAPAEWAQLQPMLKSADALLAESEGFQERGRTYTAKSGDGQAQLLAKAEEIRKSSPGMSESAAYLAASDQHPELLASARQTARIPTGPA